MSEAPLFVECALCLRNTVSRVGEQGGAHPAMKDLKDYSAVLVEDYRRTRRDPATGFIASLLAARIDERTFDDEEVLDTLQTLSFGSLDTTKSVMSWSMWHLGVNQADRAWMLRDPSIPSRCAWISPRSVTSRSDRASIVALVLSLPEPS